jgi:hypothetical protein
MAYRKDSHKSLWMCQELRCSHINKLRLILLLMGKSLSILGGCSPHCSSLRIDAIPTSLNPKSQQNVSLLVVDAGKIYLNKWYKSHLLYCKECPILWEILSKNVSSTFTVIDLLGEWDRRGLYANLYGTHTQLGYFLSDTVLLFRERMRMWTTLRDWRDSFVDCWDTPFTRICFYLPALYSTLIWELLSVIDICSLKNLQLKRCLS